LMAALAKRRDQIVISFDAHAFTATPIGVAGLDVVWATAPLAMQTRYQPTKFLASDVSVLGELHSSIDRFAAHA
jgi:hypothetical protein